MGKRLVSGIVVVLLGFSAGQVGLAHADEPTPTPAPASGTSTTDELTDMVMEALEQGDPADGNAVPVPPH